MGGRFWISVVVMSVLCLANGFVVHGLLLHGDYSQLRIFSGLRQILCRAAVARGRGREADRLRRNRGPSEGRRGRLHQSRAQVGLTIPGYLRTGRDGAARFLTV